MTANPLFLWKICCIIGHISVREASFPALKEKTGPSGAVTGGFSMKKILVAALALVMLMTACCAVAEDTVKIGGLSPLTSAVAVYGLAVQAGVDYAVDEINANGGVLGKQIEFVWRDDQGDPAYAVSMFNQLVGEGIDALVGAVTTAPTIAVFNEAAKTGIPAITASASAYEVTNAGNNVFRACFIDPYQGSVAASWAIDKLGYKTAAILYDISSDYAQGFRQYFVEYFEANGGKIVADESHNSGDTDFRAQLTNIKKANPDCILLPGFYKEVALIAKQARDLGIDATLLGGDGWQSETLNEMGGKAIDGSYVVNHLDDNDPAVQPLKELYRETYGQDATVELNAYMGHDAFLLLCAAIEKAGTADPEKVAEAMTQVEVQGLTGTIRMSPEDHNPAGKEAAIQQYKYKDGKVAPYFVEKYSPANPI